MLIDRYLGPFWHEPWRMVNVLPAAWTVAVAGPQKTRAVAPPYFASPALHPAELALPLPAHAVAARRILRRLSRRLLSSSRLPSRFRSLDGIQGGNHETRFRRHLLH